MTPGTMLNSGAEYVERPRSRGSISIESEKLVPSSSIAKSRDPILGITSSDQGAIESMRGAEFLEQFETYRHQARQALQFAQVSQQRNYNRGRLNIEYEVGDLVLINPHSLDLLRSEKGLGRKLQTKYDGPFEIIQKLGATTYQLRMPASYRIHPILNMAHLELYRSSDPDLGERPVKNLNRADFTEIPEYEVEKILKDSWRKARNG